MHVTETAIKGCFQVHPSVHQDPRGFFVEAFNGERISSATGVTFDVAQVNTSLSAQGTVRGLHARPCASNEWKYVFCSHGTILDMIIDLRRGSPTFGSHVSTILAEVGRSAVLVAPGVGHGFQALTDNAVVTYAVTTGYDPEDEFRVHPFDPDLRLPWRSTRRLVISERDAMGMSFRQFSEGVEG